MRFGTVGGVLLVIAIAAVIIGYSAFYSVYQTQQALIVRLGQPVRVVTDPGLHVKMPFIDSVITFDKRILDLESPAQELIASDQKRLVVDAFARYRIVDLLRFYQTLGSIFGANSQLAIIMNSSLRRVLGEASFQEVVRDERAHLMARIREQVDREAESYGISVVDVRIRRADLPEANSQAVYQRMQDVTVLIAEATSKAEQTRGEGDAERNRIFADAFNRDKDFFAFYRSMQAYEAAFQHNDTRMLLKPESEFFRFFVAPGGNRNATPGAAFPPAPSAPAAGPQASGGPQTQGAR
jgi:membrane protease subunit HflC